MKLKFTNMKTKLRKFGMIATMLLLFINVSKAQNHLAITGLINWPDTAYCYVPYDSIQVVVKNMSSTLTFTDNLFVYLKVLPIGPQQPIVNGTLVTLAPLASATFVISPNPYYFNPGAYAAGHDVVIVWPAAVSITVSDTLTSSVWVNCNTGIDKDPQEKSLSIFPNPSKETIFFKHGYAPSDIKYVRIKNMIGEELMYINPKENTFSVEALAQGVYFMEISLKNGNSVVEKFVKE